MNLFELVKSSITVKQAAEKYGLQVNRNGMTCCPFHDDHTPSMRLNNTFYYCFGCRATGDVIDFVAQLFGLSKYEAAKKLAADFGIDPDTPPTTVAISAPCRPKNNVDTDEWVYCQHVLLDYLELLGDWSVKCAPTAPNEPQDGRFLEALRVGCYVEYLLERLDDRDNRAAVTEKLLKSGLIFGIETTVKRARKEAAANEQKCAA